MVLQICPAETTFLIRKILFEKKFVVGVIVALPSCVLEVPNKNAVHGGHYRREGATISAQYLYARFLNIGSFTDLKKINEANGGPIGVTMYTGN